MAIEFIDSFEHYQTSDLLKKWNTGTLTYAQYAIQIIPNAGRRNDNALYLPSLGCNITKVVSRSQNKKVAMGVKFPTLARGRIITFSDFGFQNLQLELNANGTFSVYNGIGNGVLLATSIYTINEDTYYWLEVEVVAHPTYGAFRLKVNGTYYINISGVPVNGANDSIYINSVTFGYYNPYTLAYYISELFIANSFDLSYNGNKRVDLLVPNGTGNYSQFTNSNGNSTNNFDFIDEIPADILTSYVKSSTDHAKDTYTLPNIPHNPKTINAIQVISMAQKDEAGNRSLAEMLYLDDTDFIGKYHPLIMSMLYYYEIYETNPSLGLSWSKAALDSLEAGQTISLLGS